MLKLFSAFRKNKIWDFNGGIHPPEMKTQSNGTPLRQVPLAQRFVIPLKQHIGAEGELCVSVGDKVLRGQPLTRGRGKMLPVHAPTSGTVTAIAPHSTAHPSAAEGLSVIGQLMPMAKGGRIPRAAGRLSRYFSAGDSHMRVIPTKYPSGGAKQLSFWRC